LKHFFLKFFTWWHGQTFGTQLWTRLYGDYVGSDEFGNKYYRRPGKDPTIGVERRWVIYNGLVEASKVPPGWSGWLHNTVATAPSEESYRPYEWQLAYHPNYTGTDLAYRPSGSTLKSGERPPATGDYTPWTPG
jgi:NADH:ubiquinone oxidoreductase subunit